MEGEEEQKEEVEPKGRKNEGKESWFILDLGKIKRGEDGRTTLMIRNIPNKYD